MHAFEFHTTVRDGKIEIPVEYRQQIPEQVRVILLAPAERPARPNLIDQLLAQPLGIRGLEPLKRDVLYE